MIDEPVLISCLNRHWGLAGARVTAHNGGLGSQTWFVCLGDQRWVAKAVPPDAGVQFAGGLAIAQWLEQAGIPAGAPLAATGGDLVVSVGDDWLALLTWVPGNALTGQVASEQAVIGMTLARVHLALAGYQPETPDRFHWVDPDADYLLLRPWLRPAIVAALDALDAARPGSMSCGMLHADPAPGAFRLDPSSGRCGVIDWSYAICGPLLYDLASAVMYVGGPARAGELIRAYLAEGSVLGASEVQRGLEPMLRFRWAVQANYFAWRIAGNNLTGIGGPEDNEIGLAEAQRFLT